MRSLCHDRRTDACPESGRVCLYAGAGKEDRIRARLKGAILTAVCETAILAEGIRYLHIEGAFYCGIDCLFLLYGLYRALGRPGMSVVLTIISLGTRVILAYAFSGIPSIGVVGIWWAVPIGWFLADAVGLCYYWIHKKHILPTRNYS